MKRRLALRAPYVDMWQLNNELVFGMMRVVDHRSQPGEERTLSLIFFPPQMTVFGFFFVKAKLVEKLLIWPTAEKLKRTVGAPGLKYT